MCIILLNFQISFEELMLIFNVCFFSSSMSWQDCYLVGEYLYAMQDYNHTIPWLKQSTKMLMAGDFDNAEMTLEFLEIIAEYHKTLGKCFIID